MSVFSFSSGAVRNAAFIRTLLILAGLATVLVGHSQIFEPDGLRLPGDWNGWTNTQGMGGPFDLQKVTTGTPRWQSTFQYTGTTGIQAFKFASTSFGNPWGNQWAGNAAFTVNSFGNVTYGTPADPNNQISVTQNKWYTVIFQDAGYANTRAIFMETSATPADLLTVEQQPVMVTATDPVGVTATLSVNPSPEEHFFLAYSTDAWATATLITMTVDGGSCLATIPAQPTGTTVEYYLFSSAIATPTGNWDMVALRMNNNGGQNFSYLVGDQFSCGQVVSLVTTEPAFPQEGIPVTITFNAELGNGGLYNYTGDVYAHTGVITNLSTGPSDWKYVKTQWGQNTPETKLTRVSANLYTLQINDIRTYYGVPASEQIKKLAFVFRGGVAGAGGSYPEAKNADGSDIFVDVYTAALHVKIMNPTPRDPLASPNQVLPVCVEALQNQTISVYLGDQLLKTETTSSLSYPLILQGMAPGAYWVKAVATGNTGQARDSVSIYLRGPVVVQELPAGVSGGINYIDNGTVTLVLPDPAAHKSFAFALGEFSNWLPNDQNYMKRTPDGKNYWVTLTGLTPNKEYAFQYYIDGKLKIADPYCDKILDPWSDKWIPAYNYPGLKSYPFDKATGPVSVIQTAQAPYAWEVPVFTPQAVDGSQQDLMIYELLLRDFTDSSAIVTAIDKLDYLAGLGVNAVELMPVAEFDGNESWGYAPNFYFAPDKFYGRKQDYKKLIDECHKRGIAVIFDIVLNHCFGQCPLAAMYFDPAAGTGQPSADNPWLNPQAPHPMSIGYDFNHESPYTRAYFKQVLTWWLTEYNGDGFRFDLSKGLTQKYTGSDVGAWGAYDQGRIDILTDYFNHIKSVKSKAYMILEHFADNSEQTVLADKGMLLWSGMHANYKQTGIGWTTGSDLSWAYHANRGWTHPNLVDYMETHDEERVMFEALTNGNSQGAYSIRDTSNALHHQEMATALFLGIPGPKMVWQFGETGYDYSIMFNGGRTANKPPRWDYFSKIHRNQLFRVYSGMAKLRKSDAFRYGSFNGDLAGDGKRIQISHSSMDVVIAGNMTVNGFDMAPRFQHGGTWYDYFSGESFNITDPQNQTFNFPPGAFRVFTSVKLPSPSCAVAMNVVDSVTNNPVSGANILLNGVEIARSDNQGAAAFRATSGNCIFSVSKSSYKTWKKTQAVDTDISLTAKLVKGSTGIGDGTYLPSVKLYPNPARDRVRIEAETPLAFTLFSGEGKPLMSGMTTPVTYDLDLRGLPSGIYLIRFTDSRGARTLKLVVQ